MKVFKYVVRNAARNKLRSLLTALSVCFCLAMMTVLYGYLAMQEVWSGEAAEGNRLVVMNIQGFAGKLPIAYVDRVRQMNGVLAAVPYSWFGGKYKDERMPFAQFGTDPSCVFEVWDEFTIDGQQLRDWQENRQGCVVDRRMAERRGWKIGDRIPLQGSIYPFDLDLTLCGTYDSPQPADSLWFHWNYLEEGLKQMNAPGAGNAGTIFAKAESTAAVSRLCKRIDDRYASSEHPTRTQTEAAFAQMFVEMLGNVKAFIQNIAVAVIFSLTLVTANAMAIAMRERTTEIAVLKAIGFQRSMVLCMILGESSLIALAGGVFGIALGCGVLQMFHQSAPQMFPFGIDSFAGFWLVNGVLTAGLIGVLSGAFPALRAAQLSVVDGLRRII